MQNNVGKELKHVAMTRTKMTRAQLSAEVHIFLLNTQNFQFSLAKLFLQCEKLLEARVHVLSPIIDEMQEVWSLEVLIEIFFKSVKKSLISILKLPHCPFFFSARKHAGFRKLQVLADWERGLGE